MARRFAATDIERGVIFKGNDERPRSGLLRGRFHALIQSSRRDAGYFFTPSKLIAT